ncbi:glucokinase regulatory protein-like [Octopus vulgaris]|uniref:Glucokinase regulatory protein-like n=1 Tax=Octopus vulgaris TaxID=6645 RepID=A0AA36AUB5_OCTVU|nr:glucokinase regulatory protein-like [Octopus vulgaris]
MEKPVTERRNPITTNIDVSTPQEIVKLLESCDSEIFSGWGKYKDQNVFSDVVLNTIATVQQLATSLMQDPVRSAVVLSGCGTSGRLAFLLARAMNSRLKETGSNEPCFRYIIAGGDEALFTSQELYEDDPQLGADLLEKATVEKSQVLYVGITCGLSAPFVAGQLDYCIKHLTKYTPVLIGFNPSNLSRKTSIEKWGGKSFYDVMKSYLPVVAEGKAFLINPIVGPEAICGSSRMKGGSITKIILESIFIPALLQSLGGFNSLTMPSIFNIIAGYQAVCRSVYSKSAQIAEAIELSGTCLQSNGHLYYIGHDSIGIMSLIDASECCPTFGSDPTDVNVYLDGGYHTLANQEGDLSVQNRGSDISLKYFNEVVAKHFEESDLIVVLNDDERDVTLTSPSLSKCKTIQIHLNSFGKTKPQLQINNSFINLEMPWNEISDLINCKVAKEWSTAFCEFAAKLVLNAISTGAHILKGKVFQNIMVDLKLSNNKLYHRAIGILTDFTELSQEEAEKQVLRVLYDSDELSQEQLCQPISGRTQIAKRTPKVLPTALLIGINKCSVSEARQILSGHIAVRKAIADNVRHTQ